MQIILAVHFFGIFIRFLVMRNYAKNYASTIYQDLLTLYLFDLENILSDFEGSLRFVHFGVGEAGV